MSARALSVARAPGSLFVSIVVFVYLFAQRHSIIPKTCPSLLRGLLGGVPAGSIMISYTWRDSPMYSATDIRRLARCLPCRWLDVDSLLPGIPLEEACIQGANNCLFGVLCISAAYLESPMCLTEFLELTKGDKRNIVLLFPDAARYIAEQRVTSAATGREAQAEVRAKVVVQAIVWCHLLSCFPHAWSFRDHLFCLVPPARGPSADPPRLAGYCTIEDESRPLCGPRAWHR